MSPMAAPTAETYTTDEEALRTFFEEFEQDDEHDEPVRKYKERLQAIADRTTKVFELELDDVADSPHGGEELCDRIVQNARRYVEIISSAIDAKLPVAIELAGDDDNLDVMNAMRAERMREQQRNRAADGDEAGEGGAGDDMEVLKLLRRRYQVVLLPRALDKSVPLRHVMSAHIGRLVTIKGIVTRVTAVKPQLQVATYTCDQCGNEIYQEISGRAYMPPTACPSPMCIHNRTNGRLRIQTRGCKFIPYQEVRVQEEADQVPVGHVPRALTVHAYGETTRACSAGDIVDVSGIFLPVPFEGGRGARTAGLIADTFLEASRIVQEKKASTDERAAAEMAEVVSELAAEGNVYEKLGRSIAPEIFAHEDVKKALLLLLVGGVTNVTEDGMRIRGDINICLMGDPGVAKSQLLKHVGKVAPRCVYTTGKGSSGVGLTAAVTRDTTTGEAVLEGGALVLADMGICCIDEFDKMEDADRTAIHEVMEQQTVSIAKAGITTTLNARTSVLAAANPAWSRWNPTKTVAENVNLPAALLSRFDLMWLILDKPDLARDKALAEHVTYVHSHFSHPPMEFEALDARTVRAYVSAAKRFEPTVPPELTEHIVDEYVALRQKDALNPSKSDGFTSARTLLAILRLGQALARLRFSETVGEEDIAEARRLMEMSKDSVTGVEQGAGKLSAQDMTTRIAELINDRLNSSRDNMIALADVMAGLCALGATQADVDRTVDEYEGLNVWQRLAGNNLKLVNPIDDMDE